MATLKKYLAFLLGGAILGAVVASLIAPGLIHWYHDPGGGVPVGFDPSPFARQVTSELLKAQMLGAAVGGVLLLALALAFSMSRRKPEAPVVAPSAPPPNAPKV